MRWTALILLAVAPPATAAENYCHKPDVIQEWADLLAKYPQDPDVIRLYALREGLCEMIDRGLVELDQAIDIFNAEHTKAVIEQFREDKERRRGREL